MGESFVHPQAICETERIGPGTKIWAFVYILEGAAIGSDVNICSHTFIEGDVVVGDRVTIKSGVQLWNGVRLEDDVFIGPNVSFSNDRFPRSKAYPERFLETRVCRSASIGAGATLLPGITIGRNAIVGAGAVVTRSVPPNAIVVGNPARISGYADAEKWVEGESVSSTLGSSTTDLRVGGVSVRHLPLRRDMRGSLVASEFGEDVPFAPQRSFLVFDVPGSEIRGEHAHRVCHQFLLCVRGACSVIVDDGNTRETVRLDHPTIGIHIPPMVWGAQFKHSSDAVLLVLASHAYDPDDYIRDYQEFLDLRADSGR